MIVASLALGVWAAPPAALATTPTANGAACFGGTPENAVSGQSGATDLRVHGNRLYWAVGGELRSADPGTGRITVVGPVKEVRAMDARWVASISANNQLWILDRRTKKTRVLVDGLDEMEDQFVTSSIGLHGAHVYFGRTAPDFRADDGGFFRVAIAGNRPPERLAQAPNANRPFVVAGGAVVWIDVEGDAFVLHRRPVASRDGAREEVVRLRGSRPLGSDDDTDVQVLRLEGDQLWFAAANGIWSAPLDGRGPARERVPNAWEAAGSDLDYPRELVSRGACVYWATMCAVERARIDGAVEPRPETLAAEDQSWETSLATDGRYLYWTSRAGQILRAGPK